MQIMRPDFKSLITGAVVGIVLACMAAYEYLERHGRDYIRLATTGGVQFPNLGLSADHVVLVTVSESGVDIANLLMEGILDKTGRAPLDGDSVCFELADCGQP
jgi:hypothetical protein